MRRFMMALVMLAALISMSVGWSRQKAFAAAPLDTTSKYKIINEKSGFILGILSPLSLQAPRRFNGATTAPLITSGNVPVLAVAMTRSYNP